MRTQMKSVNTVSKQEQQKSIAVLALVPTQTHTIDLTLQI